MSLRIKLYQLLKLFIAYIILVGLIMTLSIPVLASGINGPTTEETQMIANVSSGWTVIIPKNISLINQSGAINKPGIYTGSIPISVTGDIAINETITVTTEDSFDLVDENNSDIIKAEVTQGKTAFTYDDIRDSSLVETNHIVKADLTPGNWSGILPFYINMIQDVNLILEDKYQITSHGAIEIPIMYSLKDGERYIINSSEETIVDIVVSDNKLIVTPINGGVTDVTISVDDRIFDEFKVDVAHAYVNGVCELCGEVDASKYEAGLYDENWNLTHTWEELVDSGVINIYDGVMSTNYFWSESTGDINSSKDVLMGKLVIADGITGIIDNCFFMCDGLTDVALPDTLETIGGGAFMIDSLNNIFIGNESMYFKTVGGILYDIDMTTIIDYPVHKTETHFDLPDSVTKINGGAFRKATSLQSISIPEGVTYIGNRAFDETGLRSITFPSTVTYLGEFAFKDNMYLVDINLNDGLEYIGKWAFGGCGSMTKIYIPESVKTIDYNQLSTGIYYSPFVWCSQWLRVYCGASSKQEGWAEYWNCYAETNQPEDYLLETHWGVTREEYEQILW